MDMRITGVSLHTAFAIEHPAITQKQSEASFQKHNIIFTLRNDSKRTLTVQFQLKL